MLRTTTTRSLPATLTRAIEIKSSFISSSTSRFTTLAFKKYKTPPNAVISSTYNQLRWSTSGYSVKAGAPQLDKIDKEAEKKLGQQKLEPNPDVSVTSTIAHTVFEPAPKEASGAGLPNDDVLGALKSDLKTVKETFALNEVPRESYFLGLAGTLPYLATSMSTVFLSYNINHAPATGSNFMFTPEHAHQYLAIIEPIQIGYGAVILSFLGAIHWGLEYAGYGGYHSYRRYAIGVAAPAVAWPTMLMPIEYALITQFAGFTALYFADTKATKKGWAPPWYSTYRFVLTFVVGVSIVISLIGRREIAFKGGKLPSPSEGMRALREGDRAAAGEKESVKEKRAEQETPGLKQKGGEADAERKNEEEKEEESDDDEGRATPDDSEDDSNDGGDDKGQQEDKKNNQDKKASDEGSGKDDKKQDGKAQPGKKEISK